MGYHHDYAEYMDLVERVFSGLMWYYIVGIAIGVIAVIIGVVVIFRELARQRAQLPPYGQYPPQQY